MTGVRDQVDIPGRTFGRCILWGLGLLAWIVVFPLRGEAEDRISVALQLSYRIAEIKSGDEERIDSSFLRLYKVRLSKDLSSTVNFTGSFDLSEFENNELRSTSQVPELRLSVCSDVVNGNVGYRLVEKGLHGLTTGSDEARRTTESWNLDLATAALERTNVRLSYRRDRDFDHLPIRETDSLNDDLLWTIDHELLDSLSVGYRLRLRESRNLVDDVRQDIQTNEGWLRFNDRYLDDALSISGSYTHTVTETDLWVGNTAYDVENQKAPLAGLGRDTTPSVEIALNPLGALIDGDLQTSVGLNIGGGRKHEPESGA